MTAVSAVAARLAARLPARRYLLGAVLVVWVLGHAVLGSRDNLALGGADLTPLHESVNRAWDAVDDNRNSNPFFLYFVNYIRLVLDESVRFVQALISQPSFGRPVPVLGWLGVVALAAAVTYIFGNIRVALLTAAGFVSFGLLGLWAESMDTLALTLTAVAYSLGVGIPLGVWAGLSARFDRLVTPVLDFMQTMPTFVYLAPLTLFFLIGPASATIATMIYAIPPAIRITAHAIREVSPVTLEASRSLGATAGQTLRQVRLPLARRTIIVGVNQTIMAALAMATIAALIDAPGLGKTVLKALQTLDIGAAFNAGLAIVIMAVVLDRATTAAGHRVETRRRAELDRSQFFRSRPSASGPSESRPSRSRFFRSRPSASQPSGSRFFRRVEVAGVLGAAAVLCYLSYTYVWAAVFPIEANVGPYVRRAADAASGWVQDSLSGFTDGLKNLVTYALLNPLESLLAGSPWWLVFAVGVAVAALVGGTRAAVVATVGLAALIGLGLWQDSMVTLAATLVATILVMALGVTAGVWMGRSDRADAVLRPVLDAGQTMPAFVYLVPILGLFGPTRFTAIIAAVVFAAPVAIKLVAEGIRGVSHTTVEAARSAGSSAWQVITKVQLPMARGAVALAANQGLIYVLSMVVVGGLVGAGALGYDVVAGFSQHQLRGKGLAAGLAIVVLGIVLDRVTRAAQARTDRARVIKED